MTAVSLQIGSSPYTQDFNSLASAGTSSTLPAGWVFLETGTNANSTYTAGTGSGNAGDTYSFGGTGSADRALGGLLSGSLVPLFGASFQNNSGTTLSEFTLSYVGEQWRLGTNDRAVPDRLDFQYSLNATSLDTGTWTDFNALDFTAPVTTGGVRALDGNLAANRTSISSILTDLTLEPGVTLWIRWVDFNASGADDGLAVDDFSLSFASAVPDQPVVTVTAPDNSASEQGQDPGTFLFTRTGDLSNPLTVIYTVGGTASADDFTPALSGQIVIPANATTASIVVTPVDDNLVEGSETVVVTVQANGYTVGGAPATITIFDNDVATTLISTIQGAGATSPMVNQVVTIEAIVVGDFQGSAGLSGFYVQEEDSDQDGNPLTSEGLFIFQGASYTTEVAVGDLVRVTGRVAEFTGGTSSLTQLTSITSVQVIATGQPLPAATTLLFPVASPAQLEALEGMRVSIATTMTVTDTFTLGRFGEVLLSTAGSNNQPGTDGRLDIYTQYNTPSVDGYNAYLADIATRRILLDDANGSQNQDPIVHGRGGLPLSAENTLRGGDTVANVVGILDDRFGNATNGQYRIQPTEPVNFQPTNPRPDAPDVEGRIKVASFNVLNFFNGPSFPTPRGANNPTEYTRQLNKLVAAIDGMGADVVGVIEIENDGYGANSALASLVAALNAVAGAGTYAYIDPGRPTLGSDEIAVGFIYRTATVEPSGAAAVLDSSVDARFNSSVQRPSLAQTFVDLETGAKFTPVINHLKSKGTSAGGPGDADAGDGQGLSNGTRTQAALALADWIASDPTGSGDPDFILMGDFNAYAMEDPMMALRRGADDTAGTADDLSDLIGADKYGYSFNGQWGALDHALGTQGLLGQVVGAGHWHINADEPTVLDYNLEFKTANLQNVLYAPGPFRSSDHDPVIVGLNPGLVLKGTARGDVLLGSIGNDHIVGAQGRDLLLGSAGADRFEFTSLLDLFDVIGDFEPGVDRLDIRALMAAVGAAGADPVAGGYLGTIAVQPVQVMPGLQVGIAYTLVTFDPDGSAGPAAARPLVELIGVTVSDPADLLGA